MNLVKNRLKTLNDLKNEIKFLDDPQEYDKKSVKKLMDKGPLKLWIRLSNYWTSDIEIRDMKQSLFEWGRTKRFLLV